MSMYLPEDIIIKILSKVPAKFWMDHIKYVCKAWAAIPHDPKFVNLHLLRSKSCVYLQDANPPYSAKFFQIDETKFKFLYSRSPFLGRICDSQDGILLIRKECPAEILYVANPITMQVVKLSPIPKSCFPTHAKIAHINNGKFKVILPGRRDRGASLHWYALTVDRDMSWREISCYGPISYFLLRESISVCGFANCSNKNDHGHTIAIDLNDEAIQLLLLPEELMDSRKKIGNWSFLKMGNH